MWFGKQSPESIDFPIPVEQPAKMIEVICPHCKRHGKIPATKRGMIRCAKCQYAWDPIAEAEQLEKQVEVILAKEASAESKKAAVTSVVTDLPPNVVATLTSPRWAWWVGLCRVLTIAVPGLGHMLIGLPAYSLMPLAFVCLIGAPFTLLTTLLGYLWLASWAESDFSERLRQARAQAALS